jgi:hypothetical protein
VAVALLALACTIASTVALAQWRQSRRAAPPRTELRSAEVDARFRHDAFTFIRIRYDSMGRSRWGDKWRIDYPDADLNFSLRLQQVTSMIVNAEAQKVIRLTDPELFDYPFIYIVEPGDLIFREEEVVALRRYLLNGGFLMVDDFWGEDEWDNFYQEIKRVLPEFEPQELPLDHPVFHAVFELKAKPQIPNVDLGTRSQIPGNRAYGITWEQPDARTPHYRGIHDEKGRMMVIICHNTDLGDGWEREGENEIYFRQFSEKWAYPLGINILFYAMTH